ncbi:envelope stress response membrane protein PspC [Zobellella maritima]|uniref:envelope stress response membrane protein PspC n=1 Tax=Zobellella maritima TaxID=2059725 RepID=UPI000E309057|nr:envelope stress response membrane protein PspC [Zobellella maritima]
MASTLINLYRDKKNGRLGGVCAGIAHKLGVEPWLVRIFALTGLVFASFLTLVAYIAAWLLLDTMPDEAESSPAHIKTTGWQSGLSPQEALQTLEQKLRALNGRVAELEQLVVSPEFRLRREFNDLREGK